MNFQKSIKQISRRIMINNYIMLVAALLIVSCSKEDEPSQNTDKEVASVTQVLNGKFVGSLYSSATNTTETEEITFSPYSSAKEVISIIDGSIKVYGTSIVTKYTNDHLLEVTNNCYYSVNVDYIGAQPTVSFYPYHESGEINNREDRRIITILSNSSFKMRRYGLTEINDKTFTKQ
jgi:hypothetical protein